MKKVKVMLLAIAVIAIAAGTLAFKAKGSLDFCTVAANETAAGAFTCTTTNPGGGNRPLTCNVIVEGRRANPNLLTPVCATAYTTTEIGGDPTCVNTTNCATTKIEVE